MFKYLKRSSCFVLLTGCMGHYSPAPNELDQIQDFCNEILMSQNKEFSKEWGHDIAQLNPKKIYRNGSGEIYIVLNSFFVSESGLLCTKNNQLESEASDPSYKILGNNVYSYVIKG